MSRTRTVRRALVLAVLPLAACRKADMPAPQANVVVINTADYSFTMPDTIPAGLTRFRLVNNGPSMHHAVIAHLAEGRTFDSLVAALRNPGPPPAWFHVVGSPNAPGPGDTTEVIDRLEAGQYAVLCFIPDSAGVPHIAHGMMKALVVTAASGPEAAEPVADIQATLTDYDFAFDKPLTAGRHTIRITNTAAQPHEMFFARLDSGVTAPQLVTWVRAGMHGRPPATPEGGIAGVAPNGGTTYLVVNLPPGTYGLFCFLPDAGDGKEHIDHGMIKQVTVN